MTFIYHLQVLPVIKRVYINGDMLPSHIKDLNESRGQFKNTLKDYLSTHTFYSVEKYFNVHDVCFMLVYHCKIVEFCGLCC